MPRLKARKCACGCSGWTSGPDRYWLCGHSSRSTEGRARMAEIGRRSKGKPEERLLKLMGEPDPETGCRDFMGRLDRQGYGVLSIDDRNARAHRVVFQLFVRPLQPGEVVHHRCERPTCCEPTHLQALQPGEHTLLHLRQRREARLQAAA